MVSAVGSFTFEEKFIISKVRQFLARDRDYISVRDQIALMQLGLLSESPEVWTSNPDREKYFGIPYKRYFVLRPANKPGHLAEAERVLAPLAMPKDDKEEYRILYSFLLLQKKHWDSIPSVQRTYLYLMFWAPNVQNSKTFPRPVDCSDEESDEEIVPVRKSFPRPVDYSDEESD